MSTNPRRHGVAAATLAALVALGALAVTAGTQATAAPAPTRASAAATETTSPNPSGTPTTEPTEETPGTASISATILDPEGNGIPGFEWTLDEQIVPADGSFPYFQNYASGTTDSTGRVVFEVPADGESLYGLKTGALPSQYRYARDPDDKYTFVPRAGESHSLLVETHYKPSQLTITAVPKKKVYERYEPVKVDVRLRAPRAERGYAGEVRAYVNSAYYPYTERLEKADKGRMTFVLRAVPVGTPKIRFGFIPDRRQNHKAPQPVPIKIKVVAQR